MENEFGNILDSQVIGIIHVDSIHSYHVLKNTVPEVSKLLSALCSPKQIFVSVKEPRAGSVVEGRLH